MPIVPSQRRIDRAALQTSRNIERLEDRLLLSAWYVAKTGANSNPGTLPKPFATIQQAANVAQAGDTVYIRAGVYHETVTVKNSGAWPNAPITFEPYNNESVTIDGADPITGWTKSSGSIYTAKMSVNLGTGNNQIFVDNKMVNEARWPNQTLNLSHPAVRTIKTAKATSTSATITDSGLTQSSGFWVGATINIGAGNGWVVQSGKVTASGVGWLTFSYTETSIYEVPAAGNHYYLTGLSKELDSAGEWFRNSNGTVSLWTPASDNPANHLVEAKVRKYGFDVSNVSTINIQGIHFFACTINSNANSRTIKIDHITAKYLSHFAPTSTGWTQPADAGIVLAGTGDWLTNSIIAFSAGDGVFVSGWGDHVLNNEIHDIGYAGGDSAAIRAGSDYVQIDHNTVYNCGRSGIDVYGSSGTVTYNIVHDFGLQDTDCGGIYTFGASGGGTVIADNTVYNGITPAYGGTGIFLDNNSTGFIVDHNITYNVNTAMKMNETSLNNAVVNNTLIGTQYSVNKTSGAYDWSGSIIENNIFNKTTIFGNNALIAHNVVTGSGFVNAAAGNYQLAAGSLAIGAGTFISPYTDQWGTTTPDAGALQYGVKPFANGAVIGLLPGEP